MQATPQPDFVVRLHQITARNPLPSDALPLVVARLSGSHETGGHITGTLRMGATALSVDVRRCGTGHTIQLRSRQGVTPEQMAQAVQALVDLLVDAGTDLNDLEVFQTRWHT